MKKTYLRSAVVMVGAVTTSLAIYGQAGGGAGGGAAGGAGGGAVGGSVGGVTSGARVGGATAVRNGTARTGAAAAQTGTARGLNTAGQASVNAPLTTAPVGGATALQNPQNVVGGSAAGNSVLSTPNGGGTLGTQATLPGTGSSLNQQGIPVGTLPSPVQTTLQGATASGQVGAVTQVQGLNGPVYQADVTENGLPVQLQISQTGQILSRTPVGTGIGPVTTANGTATTLANAQAGIPVSSLPQPVQSGLQTVLGANGQVQTVSRDDLANGTVYRVTTTQNGIPTEMRFSANGTLIGSNPINGALTSAFTPGTGAVIPGTAVALGELPTGVQSAIRSQVGNGRINQITQQQGTNGVAYAATYDANGRPMVMTIGPDGRVISNNPIAVGAAAGRTTGTGTSTNGAARATNATTRTSMRLDQVPDAVKQTLNRTAKLAEVRSVTKEERVGGDIYTVSVRSDNSVGDLVIAADGKVISDNRRNFAEFSVPKGIVDEDRVTGIPFSTVPIAIQESVKAYATASDIRSITLGTDKDGKTVYDVVFYRDGRRDRMIVAKDGTLRRIEQNVSPAFEVPDPKKEPVIALGDLPQAVQDTVRRQTENVRIKDIGSKQMGSETVYQVHYETNGAPVELLVATDGHVVLPEERETNASPLPAPVSSDEIAHARVVQAGAAQSSGTAATAERGALRSNAVSSLAKDTPPEPAASSKVDLSDVPVAVQNAAKKLAGPAAIDSISPKLGDNGVAYEVAFLQNGARRTILVNKDGVVVKE